LAKQKICVVLCYLLLANLTNGCKFSQKIPRFQNKKQTPQNFCGGFVYD